MSEHTTKNYWGLGPAFDLQEESKNVTTKHEMSTTWNCLIVGAGDCRHVIKTIACCPKHSADYLNLCVVENSVELIARQLLFLSLFHKTSQSESVMQRVEIFLEIYGNTCIRAHSFDFLTKKSAELLEAICSTKMHEMLPFVSLTLLKHEECEALADCFRRWKNGSELPEIGKLRDFCMRHSFGLQYDSRAALYDWDFSMNMPHSQIISFQKYAEWRETGIAFKCREGRYVYPNKTLCSREMIDKNSFQLWNCRSDKFMHFNADIVCSPYISFGIECENEELLKKVNDRYEKNSEEISKHNVSQLMCKIDSNAHYLENKIQIQFCTVSSYLKKTSNGPFNSHFDCAYFAHDAMFILTETLQVCGVLLLETPKFVCNLRDDKKQKVYEEAVEKIESYNLTAIDKCDPLLDTIGRFVFAMDC